METAEASEGGVAFIEDREGGVIRGGGVGGFLQNYEFSCVVSWKTVILSQGS